MLRHLESASLPAVNVVGLAISPERDAAILATEYLAYSIQYRRLLLRFPLGPGPYRDRLLDAMAWLLVDLHRSGVYWGDCSLANTLFRRDGDKVQAFLVDAETSEIHPTLSTGQRNYDLDILVENVAFGLADLAALQGRPEGMEDAIEAAESVRARYAALWDEITSEPELSPDDRHAIRARVRALNDLGFAVDEIELEPASGGDGAVRLRVAVANRRFHVRKLERLTGLVALEGQARLLLNDLEEYRCWIEYHEDRRLSDAGGLGSVAPGRARTSPRLAGAGDRSVARSAAGLLRRARGEVDPVGDGRRRRRPGGRDGGLHRPRGAIARIRGRGGHVDRARHRLVDRLRGGVAGAGLTAVRARRPSATIGA